MHFLQSYYTDIGVKRSTNQDSLALWKAETDFGEVLLAVLCDGMGGHKSGELASKTAVEAFEKWFKKEFPKLLYGEFSKKRLEEQWGSLIHQCNDMLVEYGNQTGIDIGSTLTACLFIENNVFIAHVGDSRAYHITADAVRQVTMDQSVVAEAVRRGELSEEDARKDKRRNLLLEIMNVSQTETQLLYVAMDSGILLRKKNY